MDYTRTYFKMSDHPIIQDQFNYESGNLVARKTGKDFKAVFVLADHNKKYIRNMNQRWAEGHYVWMPRQDEIQKMFGYGVAILINDFQEFCELDFKMYEHPENLLSMEQLWISFYMKEKHQLTWNGEKWQKEK